MNHGWRAFLICNQIDKREKIKTEEERRKKKTIKEIFERQTETVGKYLFMPLIPIDPCYFSSGGEK